MWVRGLKPVGVMQNQKRIRVAPRVGAWIETFAKMIVSWASPSHPVWVRGLKQYVFAYKLVVAESHPVWVRGLKQPEFADLGQQPSRTPCGCVD